MKIKKAITTIICASLVCCSLAACGDGMDKGIKSSIDEQQNAAVVETVVERFINSGSSDAKKQETVYVKTAADGSVDSVIVSNWLRNIDNTAQLSDETELANIVNVKGKETFSQNGDEIVWDSQGADIYYQGTTDKQLPVTVNIEYELDGKKISPEELSGKSGHLVITFNYTNNAANTVLINDKEETIYTPFVAVTGMVIDPTIFKNVEVTNGSIISDGARNIVLGMAFPGLVESLNGGSIENELLNDLEEKIKIPGKVVINADVNDFSMGMTLTMVSSDITSSLGLDDISSDEKLSAENAKEKINELADAGDELTDGTSKLKDGTEKLAAGSKDFVEGTDNLHTGIVAYTEGVSKVASGAGELNEGAEKLDKGVSDLEGGISQVNEGAGKLTEGAKQVNSGAKQLSEGVSSAFEGAGSVSAGATALSQGVSQLATQFSDITTGVGNAAYAANQISGGIDAIVAATGVTTSEDDIDVSGVAVSNALSDEQLMAIAALISGNIPDEVLMSNYGLTAEQVAAVKGMVEQVVAAVMPDVADNIATSAAKQAAKSAGAKAANETKAYLNAAITQPQTEGGVSLQAAASTLATSLSSSYAQLSDETAKNKLLELTTGADNLAKGAEALANGIAALKTGADTLYAGTTSLETGSSQLSGGLNQISTGVSTLKEGTGALKEGTSQLAKGAGELEGKSSLLVEGSKTLADGSVTLSNGLDELLEGAIKLNDGMITFNEEGISKLTAVFGTDFASMSDRVKAISDAGKNYTTFSGSKDSEECRVKFIIETAQVK